MVESRALAGSKESPRSTHFSELSQSSSLFHLSCLFMCVQVHVSAPVRVEATGQPWVSFLFFLETAFLTGLECLKLGPLTSRLQGFT